MGEKIYKWKPKSQIPVPADVAGREIERVQAMHGGFYRPVDLVDASRPKKAPLHAAFEWDDAIAAEAYRENQSGYITRCIVQIDPEDPDMEPVRAFVSIMREDENQKMTPFYTSISHVLSDEELREQLLDSALRDIQIFQQKYANLEILAGVLNAMQRVRPRLRTRRVVDSVLA